MSKNDNKLKIVQIFLYISTFLIPFYFFRFTLFGIPTNIFETAVFFSLVIFVLMLLFGQKINSGYQPINYLIPAMLLLISFLGLYQATNAEAALGIIKGWFLVPAIYFYLIIFSFKKDLTKLSIPLLISTLLISLWAIMQKAGLISTLFYQVSDPSFGQYLSQNFRVFGPFESPNYLAMFLVPASFLSLPIFSSVKRKLEKLIIILLYLLPIGAVVLSGSRGGLLALAIGLIIIFVYLAKERSIGTKILNSSLIGMVILGIVYYGAKFGFDPNSDTVRKEIYKYSWQILKDNYIWGIGLGEYQNKIVDLTRDALSFKTHALPYALHPHNIFLAFAIFLGVLGVVGFLTVLIWFFIILIRNRNRSLIYISALTSMVAILCHGLVDTTYFKNDLSAIFWLTLAYGVINASIFEGVSKSKN